MRINNSTKQKRAFALMTAFLFVSVLAIMVGALLLAVRHDRFRSMSYSDEVAAMYVAEAGIADVMDRLTDNPGFSTDLVDLPVEGRNGTYTIDWEAAPLAGPTHSVNNLAGSAAVDGPRGPDTVPPGSAEIVVISRVGNSSRTTQVIILAAPGANDASPMAATGNIHLRGNITVDSIDSVVDGYVSGGKTVHSNSRPGTVAWQKESAADTAVFDGDVTCSCSQTTAVNLQGSQNTDYFLDNEQRAVPTIPLPSMDVATAVSDQSGYGAPTISSSGPTVLSSGTYYLSGATTIPEGLVLEDGANLFVNGDLTVDGSVTGNGKIMVNGDTNMYGDPFLGGAENQFVSLFSSGDLTLSGYDGDDRMTQLISSDPALAGLITQMDSDLNDLNQAISNDVPTAAETARASLGQGSGAQIFEQIKGRIAADPANDQTTRFLEQKMDRLSKFYGDYETSTGSTTISSDSLDGSNTDGLVDFSLRRGDRDLQKISYTLTGQVRSKELGYSHFRGFLYSNGKLTVQDGVSLLGATLADDGRGGGTFDNYLVPVDPTTYEPSGTVGSGSSRGTIEMRGGTRLTIDRSLMAAGSSGSSSGVRVASWLRR